jgi:hypothetical protein
VPAPVEVEVETRYLPTMRFGVGPGTAGPGVLMRTLRPRVSVYLAGSKVYTVAPAGDPAPSKWPAVRTTLVVATLAVLGVAVYQIAKRRRA